MQKNTKHKQKGVCPRHCTLSFELLPAFLYNESVIFTNILSLRYALTKCLGYVPTLDSKKVFSR